MSFWQLEAVEHYFSVVMRMYSFMDYDLVTLNVNDVAWRIILQCVVSVAVVCL